MTNMIEQKQEKTMVIARKTFLLQTTQSRLNKPSQFLLFTEL